MLFKYCPLPQNCDSPDGVREGVAREREGILESLRPESESQLHQHLFTLFDLFLWDVRLSIPIFTGMVGIKLDDACKPPAQLQTVKRSQLFLLLLPNSVGPFGYNGLETS